MRAAAMSAQSSTIAVLPHAVEIICIDKGTVEAGS